MNKTDIYSTTIQPKELLIVLSQNPDNVRDMLKTYCPQATLLDADSGVQSGLECACSGHGLPPLKPAIKKVVENLINEAMRLSGGHQTQAAGYLGISQQALSLKLKQYPEIVKLYQKKTCLSKKRGHLCSLRQKVA